ncbi:MAG: outer membrane beta-barrel protein [Cyclobacteriaceae bacterium]|nr:outer membrane beta-barrel protein [Cyclobacteriaceae bacterium]
MKGRLLIVAFFLLFLNFASKAQVGTPCTIALTEAQSEFEHGHFYEIPEMVADCLNKGFSREQKITAYLLLTRTYLFLDNKQKAEESYLKLLKLNPEFTVDEDNDPIDLVFLNKKFTTSPIFSLNFKSGGNLTSVKTIQENPSDGNPLGLSEKIPGGGFQGIVGVDLHFGDYFSLGTEIGYVYKTRKFEDVIHLNDRLFVNENQTWFDVPVFIKYTYPRAQWRPFGYVGIMGNFLINSSATIRSVNVLNQTETPYEESFDFTPLRKNLNKSLFLGGGIMYKINYNYLLFEVRYVGGMNDILNEKNMFLLVDDNYVWKANFAGQYVPDNERQNNIQFTIGFHKPIYYPRKKDKMTIRDIFNKKSFKPIDE